MSQRYYSPTPIAGDTATLTDGEAHHLSRVMRARIGDAVVLFDGSGAEFTAKIQRIGKSTVELTVIERRVVDRELPFQLTLAVALPKGDRQRWLVEKAVELGVTRLVPLVTARSVADGRAAFERLRRAVIEASKQCGRNRLMEIALPAAWNEYASGASNSETARLFAHPAGDAELAALRSTRLDEVGHVAVAIGPEGGWTDEEVALASANDWRFIDLGPRILRVETAAIALAAAIVTRRVGVLPSA